MRDANSLTKQARKTLQAASSASPTEAGQKASSANQKSDSDPNYAQALVDAINQLFTEFELAYHNQFHKAFPNDQQLGMAKQLWLATLADLGPQKIRAGGRKAIQESAYLPTVHSTRQFCENAGLEDLPDAYTAYLEACNAPSPKSDYAWSHPVVYHAGRAADWFVLSSQAERNAFPVFKRHYEAFCDRLKHGETLPEPKQAALPEETETPLSRDEQLQKLAQLRKDTGL